MLIFAIPFGFYRSSKIDTQEACLGFMIPEEDITEEGENIVID